MTELSALKMAEMLHSKKLKKQVFNPLSETGECESEI